MTSLYLKVHLVLGGIGTPVLQNQDPIPTQNDNDVHRMRFAWLSYRLVFTSI